MSRAGRGVLGGSGGSRLAAAVAGHRIAPVAAAVSGTALAYVLAPTADGRVTCLLRLHTGQACPACGLSRAVGRLVHGDPAGAFAYHPYVFVLVAQVVAVSWWRLRQGDRPLTSGPQIALSWSVAANMMLLAVVWLLRLLSGHLDHVY